jgi:peptidoglycan/xylan/chitin deacetylase (PgdA/CDA1 family)
MRARLARLWHRSIDRGLRALAPGGGAGERGGVGGRGSVGGPTPQHSGFRWPQQTRAAVSLSWDDARASQLDVGMPILNQSAVRATFYLNPSAVIPRAEAWRKAVLCGHEMGNHSRHHPCSGNHVFSREHALEDYTLAQMSDELRACNDDIERLTGARPQTFAYPCGQTFVGRALEVQSYVPVVAGQFLAGRAYENGQPNDPGFCDLAQLNARRLDGLSFAAARVLIDEALEQGSWLIFAGHDIGRGVRPQTTDQGELRQLCRHLVELRSVLWVDTLEAVASYVLRSR